jgi:hypothetical protein
MDYLATCGYCSCLGRGDGIAGVGVSMWVLLLFPVWGRGCPCGCVCSSLGGIAWDIAPVWEEGMV